MPRALRELADHRPHVHCSSGAPVAELAHQVGRRPSCRTVDHRDDCRSVPQRGFAASSGSRSYKLPAREFWCLRRVLWVLICCLCSSAIYSSPVHSAHSVHSAVPLGPDGPSVGASLVALQHDIWGECQLLSTDGDVRGFVLPHEDEVIFFSSAECNCGRHLRSGGPPSRRQKHSQQYLSSDSIR